MPSISDEVLLLYHQNFKTNRPTLNDWSKLLQSEARRFSNVFVIIDALDELTESNSTRDTFLDEIRKIQPNTNLLVTSRNISSIEREFRKAARVEICASDEDIRRYLEFRIRKESRLSHNIGTDRPLQSKIVNTLAEKAQGM
jgi:archaellum biogenesis ATPase FlaH